MNDQVSCWCGCSEDGNLIHKISSKEEELVSDCHVIVPGICIPDCTVCLIDANIYQNKIITLYKSNLSLNVATIHDPIFEFTINLTQLKFMHCVVTASVSSSTSQN